MGETRLTKQDKEDQQAQADLVRALMQEVEALRQRVAVLEQPAPPATVPVSPLGEAVERLLVALRTDDKLYQQLHLQLRQVQKGGNDGPLTRFLAAVVGHEAVV